MPSLIKEVGFGIQQSMRTLGSPQVIKQLLASVGISVASLAAANYIIPDDLVIMKEEKEANNIPPASDILVRKLFVISAALFTIKAPGIVASIAKKLKNTSITQKLAGVGAALAASPLFISQAQAIMQLKNEGRVSPRPQDYFVRKHLGLSSAAGTVGGALTYAPLVEQYVQTALAASPY